MMSAAGGGGCVTEAERGKEKLFFSRKETEKRLLRQVRFTKKRSRGEEVGE